MKGLKKGVVLRSALLLGAAPICFSSVAMAQEGGSQVSGIEDIVVTAQKREQNLQVVPISITALSAESIKANRIQDVRDLNAVAPNLTVRVASGGANIPNYSMRGILTSGSAAGTDKGISLYLDGVYIQNVQGSIMEFADIERIEVLKGPQGTLFGRNATGGAISIITRDPSGEFGVKQEFSYGNYDQFRSKTRVDLPRLGPISASMTYLHSERRGDIRNLGAGTTWDYGPATGGALGKRTSPKWLGSENVEAFAGALKFDFHPDLDLVYKFDFAENHYTPNGQGVSYLPETFLGNPNFLYELNNSVPAAQRTPVSTTRPDAVNNWFTTPSYSRNIGHNLTAKWQVNDDISFKNILAFRKSKIRTTFQLDGLGGLYNIPLASLGGFPPSFLPLFSSPPTTDPALAGGANPGAPFTYLGNNAEQHEKQWSNEFQVNISTDWFDLTAGYLHFHDHVATGGIENTFNTYVMMGHSGQLTPSLGTDFVIPANPGYPFTRVTVNSDAFFIQPEIHLTDRLNIVGGARITRDEKRGTEYAPDRGLATLLGLPLSVPIRYKKTHSSVLAGVNYRPVDDILTYAKYATGYISGGQLATIAFEPETAKSWEAGVKADLFDRRWRSNLAVFKVKYRNIQFNTSGQLTGVPSAFLFGQAVVSSADAKAWGFEWENTVVPMNGLTLTGNLGYTDFKFIDGTVFPGFLFQSGAPGYKVFQRPKWTGNASAQYETAEVLGGGHLVFRVDANFRSKTLMTSDLSQGTGPTAVEDPVIRKTGTVGASWIVNGRVGLVDFNLGGTKAQINLWGKNIFDNKKMTISSGLGPVTSAIYERARTYGIDLGFQF